MNKKRPIQALNAKARAIQSLAEGEGKTVNALQESKSSPQNCARHRSVVLLYVRNEKSL